MTRASALIALALALPAQARDVSQEERQEYVRRGQVWRPVDIASMDTLHGPQGEGSFKAGEEVACVYEEPNRARPIGGHSKKFPCVTAEGDRLKVKYDPNHTPEIFGEVAGTRLFWALGFYAERMYSVKIACRNCPEDPFVSAATSRAARVFEPATVQRRLAGEEVAENAPIAGQWWRAGEGEGWSFDELDLIEEKAGGAPKEQTDALKLLAVFVHHGDNTPNQQRILCLPDDPGCRRPVLYVSDLGGTFGGKGNYCSFRNWSKLARIWKDEKRCVANFRGTTAKFADPKISEAGRKFLADRLGRLSDEQIRNIFKGARFDVLNALEAPIVGKDGTRRKASIDDWVGVFRDKRDQILNTRCPD